jgi:uncharacterized protein (UPF0335 family)
LERTGRMYQQSQGSNDGPNRLIYWVERLEDLRLQKDGISAQERDAKAGAKHEGFDVRVLNQMLRERRMSEDERRDLKALCEVYRANLGMLDGTPLGQAARKRFERETKPDSEPQDQGPEKPEEAAPGDAPEGHPAETKASEAKAEKPTRAPAKKAEAPAATPPETIEDAREKGKRSALAGGKIIDNPYTAQDPRRPAWDEGFCEAAGHNGMELPSWLRRTEKPKKGKGEKTEHDDKGHGKGD